MKLTFESSWTFQLWQSWAVLFIVVFVGANLSACKEKSSSLRRDGRRFIAKPIAEPVQDDDSLDSLDSSSSTSNGGPVIESGWIEPVAPTAKSRLNAKTAVIVGHASSFRWFINGRKMEGQVADYLDPGEYKKGDQVFFTATSRFSGKESNPIKSRMVTIGNQRPSIRSKPSGQLNGYQVEAVDPDGDLLRYSLEDPPKGARISSAGKVVWPGPYEPGKKYVLRIVVQDDTDEKVVQVIPVTIPKQ